MLMLASYRCLHLLMAEMCRVTVGLELIQEQIKKAEKMK